MCMVQAKSFPNNATQYNLSIDGVMSFLQDTVTQHFSLVCLHVSLKTLNISNHVLFLMGSLKQEAQGLRQEGESARCFPVPPTFFRSSQSLPIIDEAHSLKTACYCYR